MVVYECYDHESSGHCNEENAYIELLSREKNVDDAGAEILYDAARKACYYERDFIRTVHQGKY